MMETDERAPDETASISRSEAVDKLQKREAWRRRNPLLPALIFLILVTQIPFVMSIYYSLTDWTVNPPSPRTFAGFDNYTFAFGDRFFRDAAWVTAKMTFFAVFLSVLFGLAMAMLLDRKFRGVGFVRTLVLTPFLVMPVVASLVWRTQMLDASFGMINWFTGKLGFEPFEFVSRQPLWSVIAVLVWQWTPFMMLILLAGLQSQSTSVLEAARVDGASKWGIFRQITLPHLRSYIELCALLGAIYLIQVFDHIVVLTGGVSSTVNLPYYVFRTSIGGGWRFGEASAYSIIVVVVTIIFATFGLRVLSGLLEGEEAA
jgi:sorbitol/mannitol transport system permease protein